MTFLETLEQLSLSTWVREAPTVFAYPTVLLLHVVGMAVMVGISCVISLRVLAGAARAEVQPLEGLYPLMWWSFGVNALTGTALMLAGASTKLVDPTFYIKMAFIFAGVAVVQMTRNRVFRSTDAAGAMPESAKALAWAALICWTGAVTAGRLLAYL